MKQTNQNPQRAVSKINNQQVDSETLSGVAGKINIFSNKILNFFYLIVLLVVLVLIRFLENKCEVKSQVW